MTSDKTISEWALPWDDAVNGAESETLGLSIAWSLESPERIAEIAQVEGSSTLGRAGGEQAGGLRFRRERPSARADGQLLTDSRISRRQLTIKPTADGRLQVENVGQCPLLVNGQLTTGAIVAPGDCLTLRNALVLLVIRRARMARLQHYPAELAFPFGKPDLHGIVGESTAIWQLRDELAFAAAGPQHVLLHGQSGSGKELAARAIHALSSRAGRSFVARNAATLPEGLVDAELFGNIKNYPNPGMPERRGLIGEADGATLFLDEIGELPQAMSAHLLRVLDRDGEYQRLGEARPRRSDLRLIAATHRDLRDLKHDLLARFALRAAIPPLAARREDIPLLVRHLLRRAARDNATVQRFFERRGASAEPRIEPALMELLLRHRYAHELRELERLLWLAISSSPGTFVAATGKVTAEIELPAANEPQPRPELSQRQLERALARANGSITGAARALGLKNRFALYRLMKRHGIEPPGEAEAGSEPET